MACCYSYFLDHKQKPPHAHMNNGVTLTATAFTLVLLPFPIASIVAPQTRTYHCVETQSSDYVICSNPSCNKQYDYANALTITLVAIL
eukprot:2770279-Amphidinium_carterae.1